MKTRGLPGAVFGATLLLLSATALADQGASRSGYSYLRGVTGDVTVVSRWNGRVEARRNMPISAGDEIIVAEGARAEVSLADGNLLHVGGGTRASFESLYAQQGEEDDFSSIKVREGSVILSAIGANDNQIPRIDTDDATVYLSPGARVRVNMDRRRGTVVIDRTGSVEVRTREGSYKMRSGQYLMVRGDEEPQIERGSFSRDRFDIWAADRMDSLSETRNASAKYVDQEYANDVVALDGYGDWNYSNTYSSYVWSPRVEAGWSPYSDGSWYYTPAGLTWWSNDPWGWYPHHYGNWFFESSWNRWCWTPANVYSPAWVYWAYTPTYVGWCPQGYYSGYSPWWNSYYRGRSNVYISVHGTFNPRQVDFRGWNFTGASRFGSGSGWGRADVIPGSRIADRLGSQVAISSRPIIVSDQAGNAREAIQSFIHAAPRVIERTSNSDSSRMAPVLARERVLPAATVEALRDRAVVAERGRLTGPAAADIAPRGGAIERGRAAGPDSVAPGREPLIRGRRDDAPAPLSPGRGNEAPAGREPVLRGPSSVAPAPRLDERVDRSPARPSVDRSADRSSDDWRSRRVAPAPAPPASEGRTLQREEAPRRQDDWRSRSDVPPARRVIEGAVPSRRDPEAFRERPPAREDRPAYRPEVARPERFDRAPAYSPREERPAQRPPAYSAPPPPRAESRPAPPPRAESRSAPAPPQAKAPAAHDRSRKD